MTKTPLSRPLSRSALALVVLLLAVGGMAGGATSSRDSPSAGETDGAEKCALCHTGQLRHWRDAYHAKAARPPAEALSPEEIDHWLHDVKGNEGPTTGNVDGRRYQLADVQVVVGTRWKQRYLVVNPATGHHQFLNKQWNAYLRIWEGYDNKKDWTGRCTACHSAGATMALHGQVLGYNR